jgi:N-acyl-D-aspartate/D-glutamate deacylase
MKGRRKKEKGKGKLAGAIALALALAAASSLPAQDFDLVIANGRVMDPESGLDAVRTVAVKDGKIAALSQDRLSGRATIDASGLVVAPGFIDLHAHGQTPETYAYQARDGVTTSLELELGTGDVDAWYAERRSGRLINYGVSIGHIPVRMVVMHDPGHLFPTADGAHRAASRAEIEAIAQRIAEGLKQGAVSIGAGFPYTPAAAPDELLAVFRVASQQHVPVHAHIRRGPAGLEEALGLAAKADAPLHVVHLNSVALADTPRMLTMIADAQKRGVNVTTEAYPYTAGMTEIQSANLDEYVNAPADRVARLEWPKTGERLTPETFKKYRQMGGPVVIHANTEEMVTAAVRSPLTAIASDAYWENGTGHPRTTGTYSKILGHYVRETSALTLMDAIRKMTVMPAERLQARVASLRNKGRLRVGADADLTVFDRARVIDRSTYRNPGAPPDGIQYVIVNGVPVVSKGQLVAGVSPGVAIRAGQR